MLANRNTQVKYDEYVWAALKLYCQQPECIEPHFTSMPGKPRQAHKKAKTYMDASPESSVISGFSEQSPATHDELWFESWVSRLIPLDLFL